MMTFKMHQGFSKKSAVLKIIEFWQLEISLPTLRTTLKVAA